MLKKNKRHHSIFFLISSVFLLLRSASVEAWGGIETVSYTSELSVPSFTGFILKNKTTLSPPEHSLQNPGEKELMIITDGLGPDIAIPLVRLPTNDSNKKPFVSPDLPSGILQVDIPILFIENHKNHFAPGTESAGSPPPEPPFPNPQNIMKQPNSEWLMILNNTSTQFREKCHLTLPHSTRKKPFHYVAQAARIPFQESFLWIFINSEGYFSISPEFEEHHTSEINALIQINDYCPILFISNSNGTISTNICDEIILKSSMIPKEILLLTAFENSRGEWVIIIPHPDGGVKEIPLKDYRLFQFFYLQSVIDKIFGESINFAYHLPMIYNFNAKSSPVTPPDNPPESEKPDNDKPDGQALGNPVKSIVDVNERAATETGVEPSNNKSGLQRRNAVKIHPKNTENKALVYTCMASDFFYQAANVETPEFKIDKIIKEFITSINGKSDFKASMKSVLSKHKISLPLFKAESSELLINLTLKHGLWNQVLEMFINSKEKYSLEGFLPIKLASSGSTTRADENFGKSKNTVKEGWYSSPLSHELQKLVSTDHQPDTEQKPSTEYCSSAPIEIAFHDTKMDSGYGSSMGQKYVLTNSRENMERISSERKTTTHDRCSSQVNMETDAAMKLLLGDMPGISKKVTRIQKNLPNIKDILIRHFSSTTETSGAIEKDHSLGLTQNDQRVPIVLTPDLQFSVEVIRYKENKVVMAITINGSYTYSYKSPSSDSKQMEPPGQGTPFTGKLRIAITSDNGEAEIYGGSTVFDEPTELQRIKQAIKLVTWYKESDESPRMFVDPVTNAYSPEKHTKAYQIRFALYPEAIKYAIKILQRPIITSAPDSTDAAAQTLYEIISTRHRLAKLMAAVRVKEDAGSELTENQETQDANKMYEEEEEQIAYLLHYAFSLNRLALTTLRQEFEIVRAKYSGSENFRITGSDPDKGIPTKDEIEQALSENPDNSGVTVQNSQVDLKQTLLQISKIIAEMAGNGSLPVQNEQLRSGDTDGRDEKK